MRLLLWLLTFLHISVLFMFKLKMLKCMYLIYVILFAFLIILYFAVVWLQAHYTISQGISILLSSKNGHHQPPLAPSFLLFNVDNNDSKCQQMHIRAQLCHFFSQPPSFLWKKNGDLLLGEKISFFFCIHT